MHLPINHTAGKIPEPDQQPLAHIMIEGELFFRISAVDQLPPFFMSIVSDADHWMFVSSNGGISAGRKDADHALFPYFTDDKITESAELTGSKTLLCMELEDKTICWEPFSVRNEGQFTTEKNLYKSKYGNKIIFEEILPELQLCFRYEWNSSRRYGFVKRAKLINNSSRAYSIKLLDGIQNIMPYGVGSDLQNRVSNLVDAYKRNELQATAGLGIYALSAIIVDKAEPSEALKATVAWSQGFENASYLLSSRQLKNFRSGKPVIQEEDVKAEKGAYFVITDLELRPASEKEWMIVANLNQSHTDIIELISLIQTDTSLAQKVISDINAGTERLVQLVTAADGIQCTADELQDARHYSNVLFNIMRGGIFDNNYQIEKDNFCNYLQKANKELFTEIASILNEMPAQCSAPELKALAQQSGNIDFIRLATEYLPLQFSRRHGDPSRPWNRFTINVQEEGSGKKVLDYEGNWRDIFQNWEALAHAYPFFLEGMVFKFLNASSFDGYNPYRITKDGFDWETIEPDDPWSYIGYWGDHQLIYLLKLLEALEAYQPGTMKRLVQFEGFVYAAVPYKIKSYEEIVKDPKSTIDFDVKADRAVRKRMEAMGADGALLTDARGNICKAGFYEKLLATILAKLTNLVPEGGIWMNTQRPEWNDANNALVGNGLSMVTLFYLYRFLKFLAPQLATAGAEQFSVAEEMQAFFQDLLLVFEKYNSIAGETLTNSIRKKITDELGLAGSRYRTKVYEQGFSGKKATLSASQFHRLVTVVITVLEKAMAANKRPDGLYHAYNLISYTEQEISVAHLDVMLEGQVAVLSSGWLSANESLALLDALRVSALYRDNQNSYLLYPNKALPGFLQKNSFPVTACHRSALLQQLLQDGNRQIVEQDAGGNLHFNGNFRNAGDLAEALTQLDSAYAALVQKDRAVVLQLFEEVFNHKAFTGRSGTFYGYEGLGSIYWHMVSKLLLAVQETCIRAIREKTGAEIIDRLVTHYYEIAAGLGIHKPPALYGAFPTDPYSHTPMGRGAQQPGMTGQVKEDILCRRGELGVFVEEGSIAFDPVLLSRTAFLPAERETSFYDWEQKPQKITVPENGLLFFCCAVPVLYIPDEKSSIGITYATGAKINYAGNRLSHADSEMLFGRSGQIRQIRVYINQSQLRF